MELIEFKKKVKGYLEKSKVDESIKFISEHIEPSSQYSKELIFIKNSFSRLRIDKNSGIQKSENLQIEENKIINKILNFIESISQNDIQFEAFSQLRLFEAVGKFEELRFTELGKDFKSRHLLESFDYSKIEPFNVEYFSLIIGINLNKITITGEQNIKFRKNKLTGKSRTLHNFINAEGVIQGEYGYLNFYNTQIEGLAIHRGNMILNISDMENIYGYLMTPDIELPGIIAIGRIEMNIIK